MRVSIVSLSVSTKGDVANLLVYVDWRWAWRRGGWGRYRGEWRFWDNKRRGGGIRRGKHYTTCI